MAAVAAVDVVVDVEQVRLTDGGGLLADGEVRRAAVVVLDALVVAAELHLVEHRLERADEHHVALDAQQVIRSKVANGQLPADRLGVLVDRDRQELDVAFAAGNPSVRSSGTSAS